MKVVGKLTIYRVQHQHIQVSDGRILSGAFQLRVAKLTVPFLMKSITCLASTLNLTQEQRPYGPRITDQLPFVCVNS
jgi:hypothetical protein